MARRRRPEDYPDDDGRTIADMNVEGMPWYLRRREEPRSDGGVHYQMTREEQRAYTWAAVKAGLLVALVFGTVFALFIAFCVFVWFA